MEIIFPLLSLLPYFPLLPLAVKVIGDTFIALS
jgi:hypothetical protein